MERIYRSVMPPEPPSKSCCDDELTRPDLEAFALTAENCEGALRRFEDSTLDDCTLWTNEKHDLYLTNLEMSFVRQLHQSMDLLVRCSERNNIDKNISQKQQGNILTASDQFTVSRHSCRQEINKERDDLFSHISADLQKPLTHAFSEKFSSSAPYKEDLFDSIKEGMGQNFVSEDNSLKYNNKSRAKRLKTAEADSSSHDQIMLFSECPKTDNSVVNSLSTLAGE